MFQVSKRATPTLTGFNDRERLLGDVALAQIRSNAKNTCRNFKHLLGRKLEAPDLQNEPLGCFFLFESAMWKFTLTTQNTEPQRTVDLGLLMALEREREKKKNSRFGSCIVPVEASNCIQACESTTFWKRDIGDIRQESAGTKAFLVHLSFVWVWRRLCGVQCHLQGWGHMMFVSHTAGSIRIN